MVKIYRKATDLSTFLVQLRQLLLVFDSHLSHFLLQGITATRVSTRTETGTSTGQDTHLRTHSGTTSILESPQEVQRQHQTPVGVNSPGIVRPLDLILVSLVSL